MSLKETFQLRAIPSHLKEENIYRFSQVKRTYIGLLIIGLTWFIYTIAYVFIGDTTLSLIGILNVLIYLLLLAFFSRKPIKRKVFTANFILFFLFLNAYPICLITGGINSSSVIWLSLFPTIMVLMNGVKNAIPWLLVSIVLLISLLLNRNAVINFHFVSPGTDTDRFLDIIMMTFTAMIIISTIEISRKKMVQKLEKTQRELRILAITDPLTKLLNRRFFIERSESEINRAKRYHASITVLMLDLDHFKRINDNFGHKAGDTVLVEVSKALKKSVRDIDLVGRYGGEEFIILCPESDSASSLQVAQRIREDIENLTLDLNNQPVRMTISIGVAVESSGENLSLDTLVQHADEALYRSKENGRNLVTEWQKSV